MLTEPRPSSSRSQFPSEHRRCWIAGTWDFPASHRGGQIPVSGCGERGRAEMTEGLEGQQRTDSPGTDTHTDSGTQICNGEPGELRVCQTPPPRLCRNRARAESPAAKLRLSSHLSPRLDCGDPGPLTGTRIPLLKQRGTPP